MANAPIALFLFAFLAFGQDEPRKDAEGCAEFPQISRFPGSIINSCEHKEFDSYSMPVSKNKDGEAVEQAFEGEYWSWDVATRDGMSELQVYRNFLNAAQKGNWTLDFQSSPDRLTAHKGDYHLDLQSKGAFYYMFVVKVAAMKQELSADATAMAAAIDKDGHVAVYGVNIDTGKSAILPASEPVLADVQTLLEYPQDLKLRIEGHTDVKPLADNASEEGRAKNRRVELVKQ